MVMGREPETRLGGAWRTFFPGTNCRGRPASPEMQPELPPLHCSALLAGKRDLEDSGTMGRSPGESHPAWERAGPAQHFSACLFVLGGHCSVVLQLQPWTGHPLALLKTTCCGFLPCKLVGLWPQHKGFPWVGWHLCHLK